MHLNTLLLASLPLAANAANIVISNDDGWAEINIRTFYNTLKSAGNGVLISAPAENKSGTGSTTSTPKALTGACEFNSCPAGSPATGSYASDSHINYVNSYPATAMEYGIDTLAPKIFGKKPDLAVAGPNVGSNLGLATALSGTVGATTEAVSLGIPGIAFSGASGSATAWNAATPLYSSIYADLALNVTSTLLASGAPYLPSNIWLNVNFPVVSTGTCDNVKDFKFVLSRIYDAVPLISGADVSTCGASGRLPSETRVTGTNGCYVSISVGRADTKRDASAADQATVLAKLKKIISCLP